MRLYPWLRIPFRKIRSACSWHWHQYIWPSYKELKEKGIACDLAQIEADIIERDERDMTREISPLKQAEDAVLIDSSNMTIEEVTDAIMELYQKIGEK